MVNVRTPYIQVRIKRRDVFVQQDGRTALQLTVTGDTRSIDGRIIGAAGDEGFKESLALRITNIPRETRRQIDPNGTIEVDLGYAGSSRVPPRLAFVGQIESAPTIRNGGEFVTTITADLETTVMSSTVVSAHFENEPIGDIIRALFERVGYSVLLPASAFRYRTTFTSKDVVLVEVQRLVDSLSHQSGRPHSLVPAVAQANDAIIGGLAGNVYKVVDSGSATGAVERLLVDWSEDDVYVAEPLPQRALPSTPIVTSNPATSAVDVDQATASLEYRASTPLDPRVSVGLQVDVTDEELGEGGLVTVQQRTHDLGSWRTTWQGIYIRDDVQQEDF